MSHKMTFLGGPKCGAMEEFAVEPPVDYLVPETTTDSIFTSSSEPNYQSKIQYRRKRLPSGQWRYLYVGYNFKF